MSLKNRRIFVYIVCLIKICLSLSDEANKIKPLNIKKEHGNFSNPRNFEPNIQNGFGKIHFHKN